MQRMLRAAESENKEWDNYREKLHELLLKVDGSVAKMIGQIKAAGRSSRCGPKAPCTAKKAAAEERESAAAAEETKEAGGKI